ncbi:hypothetical protein [Hymenobacter canadensis]|uniref:Glycosyltransferase RgtA/B/C/D-like domain-containing protein n=1 Tax=Hymenobacter canadensis TaxID=2999067 RepID=A0ABY7LPX5_9BACT|nr:hypothetical protein [Hymenobacter canadensis]WBA41951.1 hypothetical protein O3303_19350 [Hymenobacter canadensis]
MQLFYQRPGTFFAVVILFVSGWYIFFPDIIPINRGLGFEGAMFYEAVAKDFYKSIFIDGTNSYSIQRVLPFGLLHYVFRLTGLPFTDSNMLRYFELYNILIAGLIIGYWHRTARLLKLSDAATWIGYLGLLCNFATLKYDTYVPFTYDRTALLVGIMSVYYHLAGRNGLLFITALISLAVWPTALFCNLVLLLVPANTRLSTKDNKPLSILWAVGCSVACAVLCVYIIYLKQINMGYMVAPVIASLLPASIVVISIYVAITQYQIARVLLADGAGLLAFTRYLLSRRQALIYAATLVVAFLLLTKGLGTQGNDHLNASTYLVNVVFGAVTRPLQALVSHSNYYGLPVVLAVVCWRQVGYALRNLGLGIGGLFVLLLLLSVNSETRQMANLLPVLVIVTARVASDMRISPRAIFFSVCMCLLQSKFWLRINQFDPTFGQPNDQYPLGNAPGAEYVWNSPFQAYFMNIGPWTSHQFWLLQALTMLLMAIVVRWLYGPSTGAQNPMTEEAGLITK